MAGERELGLTRRVSTSDSVASYTTQSRPLRGGRPNEREKDRVRLTREGLLLNWSASQNNGLRCGPSAPVGGLHSCQLLQEHRERWPPLTSGRLWDIPNGIRGTIRGDMSQRDDYRSNQTSELFEEVTTFIMFHMTRTTVVNSRCEPE